MAEHSEARPVRDWQEIFPWLILFRAARVAVGFRILLLAALGLVGMVAGWRLCWDYLAPVSPAPPVPAGEVEIIPDPILAKLKGRHDKDTVPPWPWDIGQAYAQYYGKGALADLNEVPFIGGILGAAEATATELTLPFQILFHQGLTYRSLAYALVCCGWALVVWAYFGGMIARLVAVKLTQDEIISFKKASRFTRKRCCSYMSAPLLPLLGIFGLGVPIAILGVIANVNIGVLLAGLFWPLVICVGFLMAILLLGLLFGWPLMYSTISTEGTDAFDAISRSYAYVFQRPFHYLFYIIIATLVGGLGWAFVHGIISLVMHCTHWSFVWWLSPERSTELFSATPEGIAGWGMNLIYFWHGALRTLATAFSIGFLFSSMTAVYLLLRRHVDGVELDEVQLDQGVQHGMPALSEDRGENAGEN